MKSFPRARWIALASVVSISFLSGAWLTRAKPSAEGGVYQQARLFENVVGAIHRHYIDSLGEGDLYQRAAVGPGHLPQRPLRRAAGPRDLPRVPAADDRQPGGYRRQRPPHRVGRGPGRRQRHRPGRQDPRHRRQEHRGLGRLQDRRGAPAGHQLDGDACWCSRSARSAPSSAGSPGPRSTSPRRPPACCWTAAWATWCSTG